MINQNLISEIKFSVNWSFSILRGHLVCHYVVSPFLCEVLQLIIDLFLNLLCAKNS